MNYRPVGEATPDPIAYLSVPNAICHDEDGSISADQQFITDGGYVKSGRAVQVKPDAYATVSGVCQWWWGNQDTGWRETRNITAVGNWDIHPQQGDGYMTAHNYSPSQILDTRDTGKTQGFTSVSIVDEGVHTFRFQTFAGATNCVWNKPNSDIVERHVYALACLPQWLKDPDTHQLVPRGRFPIDGTPIEVVYENLPEWTNFMPTVITAWNTRLHEVGVTSLTFHDNPGGACLPSDNHCIRIGYPNPSFPACRNPTACSCAKPPPLTPDGLWDSSPPIVLMHNWDADAKMMELSHEFGHLLGLGESTCAQGTTVMRVTETCNGPVGSNALTATSSDALPVAKTVYDGGSTKTCGW